MSEHQPQKSSRSNSDAKREKLAEIRMDETLGDDQVKRLTRKHSPWSDWLMSEFLQYWYWLVVLAADVFLLMDVVQKYHVRDSAGAVGIIAAFVIAAVAEYLLFIRIWSESTLRWIEKDK
jgi:hypothetical protein